MATSAGHQYQERREVFYDLHWIATLKLERYFPTNTEKYGLNFSKSQETDE
jgi:hypothetical protein